MIGSLRGKLISKNPPHVIVETGGVGYLVSVPLNILSDLPPVGEQIFLHVHTLVREDAISLYGFGSEEQKRVFLTLLGVTGVGPKLAQGVISGLALDDFLRAVEAGDVTSLVRIPGLGKKTAQRIVLELKGKLPRDTETVQDDVFADTVSALMNLGYKRPDAQEAVEMARKKGLGDIESLLKEALKRLTGPA